MSNLLDLRRLSSGVHVLPGFAGRPDRAGVLARLPVALPDVRAICHFAAFQRHDPMRQARQEQAIGGGANRVQGLRIDRWSAAIEGGLFAILELADGDWLALLPIAGDRAMAWLAPDGDQLTVKLGTLGTEAVAGDLPVLAWARSASVYEACTMVWQLALGHPTRRGQARRRDEKTYPDIFNYLGWCSWEHFRRDIDADKLVAAVRAIHASGLPIRYVLIDDGYILRYPPGMPMRDGRLSMFAPCPESFPDGWQPILDQRRAAGVRWFGLWQNFNGYWGRIAEDNRLGAERNAHLLDVPSGGRLPKPTLADALDFYEAMIAAAGEAGFDFVKVDDQAQNLFGYAGTGNPVAAATCCSQALERAAAARTNGLINCMAHGPVNAFNTCLSAVTRCSEDYLLNDAWRAKAHLHNSYQNLLWLGPTVWGDHDMFHSSDRFAGQMMALSKALSGGPIYLSDDPQDFVSELIRRLCLADGRLLRPLAPAVPLPRSVMIDPFEQPQAYLVAAPLPNGVAAIVAYNLTEPAVPVHGEIRAADHRDAAGLLMPGRTNWPAAEEGLVLYDWRRGTARRLVDAEPFTLDDFADYFVLLCPIRQGWAVVGRADKYLSPAAVEVLYAAPDEIILRTGEPGSITLWRDERMFTVEATTATLRVYSDGSSHSSPQPLETASCQP